VSHAELATSAGGALRTRGESYTRRTGGHGTLARARRLFAVPSRPPLPRAASPHRPAPPPVASPPASSRFSLSPLSTHRHGRHRRFRSRGDLQISASSRASHGVVLRRAAQAARRHRGAADARRVGGLAAGVLCRRGPPIRLARAGKKNLAFTVAAPAGSVLAGFFFTLSPLMQHLMAAAAAGATYGAPVPFPVYHPGAAAAYYAHASMAAVSARLLLRCSPQCRIGGNWVPICGGFGLNLLLLCRASRTRPPKLRRLLFLRQRRKRRARGKARARPLRREAPARPLPRTPPGGTYQLSLLQCPSDLFIYFSLFPFLVLVDSVLNFRCLCSGDSGSDESSDTRDDDTDHKVPGNLLRARDHF
jgi:hypothetical protein